MKRTILVEHLLSQNDERCVWICLRSLHFLGSLCLVLSVACLNLPGQAPASQSLRLYSASDASTLSLDPNGFLLNPHWLGNAGHGPPDIEIRCRFRVATLHLERRSLRTTNPGCLSQDELGLVTLNEPQQTLGLGIECVTGAKTGLVRGHINWFPITATGKLLWNSFSVGVQDHDINIDLFTRIPNAATHANDPADSVHGGQRGYHLEFYSRETLERIPAEAQGFWPALKRALLHPGKAHRLVDNRLASVTGLYGLDGVHGFHAELHPVYALSMFLGFDTTGATPEEKWAVMFRNSGSEGDCASGMLPLLTSEGSDSQEFVVDLGTPTYGLQSAGVRDAWASRTQLVPRVQLAAPEPGQKEHLYLVFDHRRPSPGKPEEAFIGVITFKWAKSRRVSWREQLNSWLGQTQDTIINLGDSVRFPDAVRGFQTDPTDRISDIDNLPTPLAPVTPRQLQLLHEMPRITDHPLTYAEYAWPVPDSITSCCGTMRLGDPLSLNARRFVLGLSGATAKRKSLLVGYYIYPHSGHYPGEGGAADFYNAFTYLGYRFDVRWDQFYPQTKFGSSRTYGPLRSGYGFRVNPFISPNTVHLGEASLMPYTIANVGLSYFKQDHFRWTWGWGLGIQTLISTYDAFIDIQNSARAGQYVNHWVYSTGVLLPIGR